MAAQDNPMISSFVGTVMELTAEEKVAQAAEMRRRYLNDIATYEYEIARAKDSAEIARVEEAKAREDKAKAREDEAKAREEARQLQAAFGETIAQKDAEIARLQKLLGEK